MSITDIICRCFPTSLGVATAAQSKNHSKPSATLACRTNVYARPNALDAPCMGYIEFVIAYGQLVYPAYGLGPGSILYSLLGSLLGTPVTNIIPTEWASYASRDNTVP